MNAIVNEEEIRAGYNAITDALIRLNRTITTMESATSGTVASLLTDREGSSAILKGAFVTYSNEAKVQQGVPAEVIRRHGVYSPETAKAMAEACRKSYKADLGIGVTGTFGNIDPANPEGEMGEIFFAIAAENETLVFQKKLPAFESRRAYKLAAADLVRIELARLLGFA